MDKTIKQSPFVQTQYHKLNNGRWTAAQNFVYINYIKRYKSRTQKAALRKRRKIFKHMSEGVKSRTADQCRSHHQKQLGRFGSVQAIIANYSVFHNLHSKEEKKQDLTLQKKLIYQAQVKVKIEQKTKVQESKIILIPEIKMQEFKIKFKIPDNLMWSW